MHTSTKRYLIGFGSSMLFYTIAVVSSVTLLQRYPELPLKTLIALLPVVPILFALHAFLRYLNSMDEMQQRIQMNAIAFAAGATGILTFTYGFLENVGYPVLSWTWVFPLMIALWGVATAVVSRRYG